MNHNSGGKISVQMISEATKTNISPGKPGQPTSSKHCMKSLTKLLDKSQNKCPDKFHTKHTAISQIKYPDKFVPIPELGIYRQDQHVLQNGTFPQHCYSKPVVNSNKGNSTNNHHQHDSVDVTTTSNKDQYSHRSSCDDLSMRCPDSLCDFNPEYYGQHRHPVSEIYNSSIDISHSKKDERKTNSLNKQCFNPINSNSVKEGQRRSLENSRNRKPLVQPVKNLTNTKLDPPMRTRSLDDLTSGLTFSFVGQEKGEGIINLTKTSQTKELKSPSHHRNSAAEDIGMMGSVLKDHSKRGQTNPGSGLSLYPSSGFKRAAKEPSLVRPEIAVAKDVCPEQIKYNNNSQKEQQNQIKQSETEGCSSLAQSVASTRRRTGSEPALSSYRSLTYFDCLESINKNISADHKTNNADQTYRPSSMENTSTSPWTNNFKKPSENGIQVYQNRLQDYVENDFLVTDISPNHMSDIHPLKLLSNRNCEGCHWSNASRLLTIADCNTDFHRVDDDNESKEQAREFNDDGILEENGQSVCHYRCYWSNCCKEGSQGGCEQTSQCLSKIVSEERSCKSDHRTRVKHAQSGSPLDSGYNTKKDSGYSTKKDSGYSTKKDSGYSTKKNSGYNAEKDIKTATICNHTDPQTQYVEKSNSLVEPHDKQHVTVHNYTREENALKLCNSSQERFIFRPLNHSTNLVNSPGSLSIMGTENNGPYKKNQLLNYNKSLQQNHVELPLPGSVCCSRGIEAAHLVNAVERNENSQNGIAHPLPNKYNIMPVRETHSQPQVDKNHWPVSRQSKVKAAVNLRNGKTDGFQVNQIKEYGGFDKKSSSVKVLPLDKRCSSINGIASDKVSPGKDFVNIHNTDLGKSNILSKTDQSANTSSKTLISYPNNELPDLTPDEPVSEKQSTHYQNKNNHKPLQQSVRINSFVENSGCVKYCSSKVHDYEKSVQCEEGSDNHSKHSDLVYADRGELQSPPFSRVLVEDRPHSGSSDVSETDSNTGQYLTAGQGVSLFYITQHFDLVPLLVQLPQEISLRSMLEPVEVSVAGAHQPLETVRPLAGNPSPAFSPVRISLDTGDPLTSGLKVACFSNIQEEVHNYTTVGRVMDGDLIIEINGWFCLGADVTILKRILKNCKGTVTFTVARSKEKDENMHRDQAAARRIMDLESEISQLNSHIQERDKKIHDLLSDAASRNVFARLRPVAPRAVNRQVPVCSLNNGYDDYVV